MYRSRFKDFVLLRDRKNNNSFDTSPYDLNGSESSLSLSLWEQDELRLGASSSVSGRLTNASSGEPAWMSFVEEIKLTIHEAKTKIKSLNEVHKRHLSEIFSDNNNTLKAIENISNDITVKCTHAKKKIKILGKIKSLTNEESKIKENVKQSLIKSLYECLEEFKQLQNKFVDDMENKKKRAKNSLEEVIVDNGNYGNNTGIDAKNNINDPLMSQISLVDDSDRRMIIERNKELQIIEKNVRDLAELFNDVALMVSEQGTMIDRIDYNIEISSANIDRGVEEIKETEVSSSTSKARSCILLLIVLVIIMAILLIVKLTTKKK